MLVIFALAGTAVAECFPRDNPEPGTCYRSDSGRCSLGASAIESSSCIRADGVVGADLSPPVWLRLIGDGWQTWSVPPFAEDPSPRYSLLVGTPIYHAPTVTVTFTSDGYVAGMEVEPNVFDIFNITARFFNGSGGTVATITRMVDGQAGARLFGVECSDSEVHSVRIDVDPTAMGFAVGQIRHSSFPAGAGSITPDDEEVVPVEIPPNATSNAD